MKKYLVVLAFILTNVCLSQNFPDGKYVLNLTEGIFKLHFKKSEYTLVTIFKGNKPFGERKSRRKRKGKYTYDIQKSIIYRSQGDTIRVINGELMFYFDKYKYKKVGWLKYWFPNLVKEEKFRW